MALNSDLFSPFLNNYDKDNLIKILPFFIPKVIYNTWFNTNLYICGYIVNKTVGNSVNPYDPRDVTNDLYNKDFKHLNMSIFELIRYTRLVGIKFRELYGEDFF